MYNFCPFSNSPVFREAYNATSGDLFGQEFDYTSTPTQASNLGNYNGNITAVRWNKADGVITEPQAYSFQYNALNRLLEANHFSQNNGWNANNNYAVSGISYDKNGNLLGLSRRGADGTLIDNLTYTYQGQGNQLTKVSDAENITVGYKDGSDVTLEYQYDGSGNLTQALNKDIDEVIYNHLNLPKEIIFLDGTKIRYYYDATGAKLKQEVESTSNTETDYVVGRQYRNRALDFFHHAEGHNKLTANGFLQHYDLKDHLGNVRLTFSNEPITTDFKATMETGGNLATREAAYFDHVEESRQTLAYHNASAPSSEEPFPNKVATLNTANGRTKGPAKSLKVHKGDSVHIEVQASYEEHSRKPVKVAVVF